MKKDIHAECVEQIHFLGQLKKHKKKLFVRTVANLLTELWPIDVFVGSKF